MLRNDGYLPMGSLIAARGGHSPVFIRFRRDDDDAFVRLPFDVSIIPDHPMIIVGWSGHAGNSSIIAMIRGEVWESFNTYTHDEFFEQFIVVTDVRDSVG